MGGESDVISEIKRDYILRLSEAGRRYDGRAFDEYRPIRIQTGLVEQAEGSARVKLGDTDVIVGVKLIVGEPYSDRPNSGAMTTSAELNAMASPEFETGPPRPDAIELARVVDRGIRETETIDLEKLSIVDGEKCWVAFIDMHIIDYDGNLFDACSLGAISALLTATVPMEAHGFGDDFPMPVNHIPISTTAMKLGKNVAFDPGLVEDKVGGPRLTVSTDESGAIRAMQKGLEGGFTRDEVKSIIKTGRDKAADIREIVIEATGRKV